MKIEIPEGYEAKIVGNEVILEPKESEDERIRKEIIRIVDIWTNSSPVVNGIPRETLLAYLERKKEQKPIEDVVKDITKNKEAATKFLKSAGIMDDNGELAEIYLSEQKPAVEQLDGTFNSYDMAKTFVEGQYYVMEHPERFGLCKPVEWSDEDKRMIDNIIYCLPGMAIGTIEMLPSLAKQYALRLKSLFPSWKPSEQEKGALRTAIHILTEERNFPKTGAQLQNILNAFEGKESRKDWKPSEEQMEVLGRAITFLAIHNEEFRRTGRNNDLINDLFNDLKKL